ncbi:hypothetical protein BDZ89DRAFT_1083990, partial [Hymenopellis radicata]
MPVREAFTRATLSGEAGLELAFPDRFIYRASHYCFLFFFFLGAFVVSKHTSSRSDTVSPTL